MALRYTGARRLRDGRAVWTVARAPGSGAPVDAPGSATKLPVCWAPAAALPSPERKSKRHRAVRDRSRGLRGPPERSGMNYRWQASRHHLVVLALGRGARAPVRPATDTSKAAGDGHRSAHKPCGVWALPVTSPEAAPALGPRASRRASVRRRDRSSTPVRSSHHATAVARRARTRADTVAQQESRTPTQ